MGCSLNVVALALVSISACCGGSINFAFTMSGDGGRQGDVRLHLLDTVGTGDEQEMGNLLDMLDPQRQNCWIAVSLVVLAVCVHMHCMGISAFQGPFGEKFWKSLGQDLKTTFWKNLKTLSLLVLIKTWKNGAAFGKTPKTSKKIGKCGKERKRPKGE